MDRFGKIVGPVVEKDRDGIVFGLKQLLAVAAVLRKFFEGSGTCG